MALLAALVLPFLVAAPDPTVVDKLIRGAREQCSWGTSYDNAYYKLGYPNGDLPKAKGVCTDVIVRALRAAGYDLQKLIHEDMKASWKSYPRYPGNSKPDTNIDHRRVPNQRVFWKRQGLVVTAKVSDETKVKWKPGDIVTWKLGNGLDHTGILTDKRNAKGWPYVVHNLGTTLEEDALTSWTITGHYRYPGR